MSVRLRIHVSGRVQGVFFRSNSRRMALDIGLTGWVRNLPDGRVEAIVEGEREQVERFVEWCRVGPPGARVDHMELKEEPAVGEFQTFSVRTFD